MFKLFKKEEPKEKTVEINKLQDWLDEELTQIDFSKELTQYFDNLLTQKRILKEKNEALSIAQVSEKDKVEDRIRSIVIGQKNSFVTEVSRFLTQLQLPEEHKIRTTINFNTELNKKLDELAQKTTKSYQATTHLFYRPVQEVYQSIGEINIQSRKFNKKIEKKKLNKIENITTIISNIQKDEEIKLRQKEELEQKNTRINELEKEKETRKTTIQKLKESPEYETNNQQKQEKEKLQEQLQKNTEEIHQLFSKLGRALRKYQKISLEHKLIGEYLENAETLFKDEELKIVDVLKGLTTNIHKKEVLLNEKQEKNTLELLKKVEDGYLNVKAEKNRLLQEQIKSIPLDDSINLQIAGEQDKITNIERELTIIQEFKQKLEKPTENGTEKNKLTELAKELFNTNLKIGKTI